MAYSNDATSKEKGSITDIFSKMIPQPTIDRISIHGGIENTSPLKVKLLLMLKDVVDPTDEMLSTWYRTLGETDPSNSAFEEFVTVRIMQCTHPLVSKWLLGEAKWEDVKEAGIAENLKEAGVSENLDELRVPEKRKSKKIIINIIIVVY